MKLIIPALFATTMALSLAAQNTGTFSGKVLDSKGKPVANTKMILSKMGINWVKEVKVNEDGKFLQVGLEPKDYEVTVSAEGYVNFKEQFHVSLGMGEPKNYVLLTPEEARKTAGGTAIEDPAAIAESKGLESFNLAVVAFNEKNFSAALPLFEAALASLNESIEKTTDATLKVESEKKVETMERPYSYSLMEVAKTDEAKRNELLTKAEPLLVKMLERNSKDQNAIVFLLDIAKFKNDAEGITKYQAALDSLLGPRPELAYNQGVELYNAGKLSESKSYFQKAISIKADYAEAYYLLAMCEFTDMNLKGTKANLQKYLELAPTGKHAGEVKEMLKAPELKNIK
ncbi:MAG: carboxypeptidase-like regulatory domain-containing protein [Holophaga sp.]|nr:carboxypeptidase-like regulatory domain-containing protein [Holophaga sp.]